MVPGLDNAGMTCGLDNAGMTFGLETTGGPASRMTWPGDYRWSGIPDDVAWRLPVVGSPEDDTLFRHSSATLAGIQVSVRMGPGLETTGGPASRMTCGLETTGGWQPGGQHTFPSFQRDPGWNPGFSSNGPRPGDYRWSGIPDDVRPGQRRDDVRPGDYRWSGIPDDGVWSNDDSGLGFFESASQCDLASPRI